MPELSCSALPMPWGVQVTTLKTSPSTPNTMRRIFPKLTRTSSSLNPLGGHTEDAAAFQEEALPDGARGICARSILVDRSELSGLTVNNTQPVLSAAQLIGIARIV